MEKCNSFGVDRAIFERRAENKPFLSRFFDLNKDKEKAATISYYPEGKGLPHESRTVMTFGHDGTKEVPSWGKPLPSG